MEFQCINRGYEEWLLLLPGWSFLPDIFSPLELNYNYIIPCAPLTDDLGNDIIEIVSGIGVEKIHVLGWSLGATVAARFARARPDLILTLCLISIMPEFSQKEMEQVMKQIRADRIKALKNFHRRCFTGQKQEYEWFVKNLQKNALDRWDTASLEKGLSFLVDNPFDADLVNDTNTIYFHGSRDIISPAENLLSRLSSPVHVIKGVGHLPFLDKDFLLIYEQSKQKKHR